MLLSSIKSWAPFKIDALGLVTMLGAMELDTAIGRLVHSRYTEYVPLLAPHIIAGNSIIKPMAGFVLYNITDGMVATDLAGWFCRWLLNQKVAFNKTTVQIRVLPYSKSRILLFFSASILGLLTALCLLAMAIISSDWYGLANAISMIVSVIVRRLILSQNRLAVDRAAVEAEQDNVIVKAFCTLPTGEAVTISCARRVLLGCLLTTPRPPTPRLYNTAQVVGWFAFGCHILALGMSSLANQIMSVVVLIVGTVAAVKRYGCDEYCIGRFLRFSPSNYGGEESRAKSYWLLDLSVEQETAMLNWALFPQKSNTHWWTCYRKCQAKGDFEDWKELIAAPEFSPSPSKLATAPR